MRLMLLNPLFFNSINTPYYFIKLFRFIIYKRYIKSTSTDSDDEDVEIENSEAHKKTTPNKNKLKDEQVGYQNKPDQVKHFRTHEYNFGIKNEPFNYEKDSKGNRALEVTTCVSIEIAKNKTDRITNLNNFNNSSSTKNSYSNIPKLIFPLYDKEIVSSEKVEIDKIEKVINRAPLTSMNTLKRFKDFKDDDKENDYKSPDKAEKKKHKRSPPSSYRRHNTDMLISQEFNNDVNQFNLDKKMLNKEKISNINITDTIQNNNILPLTDRDLSFAHILQDLRNSDPMNDNKDLNDISLSLDYNNCELKDFKDLRGLSNNENNMFFNSDGYIEEEDDDINTPEEDILSNRNSNRKQDSCINLEEFIKSVSQLKLILSNNKYEKYDCPNPKKYKMELSQVQIPSSTLHRSEDLITTEDKKTNNQMTLVLVINPNFMIEILKYLFSELNDTMLELSDNCAEDRRKFFENNFGNYIKTIDLYIKKKNEFFSCILLN